MGSRCGNKPLTVKVCDWEESKIKSIELGDPNSDSLLKKVWLRVLELFFLSLDNNYISVL